MESLTGTKELLNSVAIATMATVNPDGSPHNSPYFFARSDDLANIYWRSRTETQHSQNLARTGQLFVALYQADGKNGGLYIQAHNARITEGAEFDDAVVSFNKARAKAGRFVIDKEVYASSPPKLYVADVQKMWMNDSEQDKNGVITRDFRVEITAADLLA
jgi:hypothetical protein